MEAPKEIEIENTTDGNQNKIREVINTKPKGVNKVINDIYGEEYFQMESQLKAMKENSKTYFNNISSEYSNKYDQLINGFENHFSKITKKIQNSFELNNPASGEELINEKNFKLIRKYSKNYLDSFNSILIMNEQIFENIKTNINILINFIDISSKSLYKKNPTHAFLDKEFKNIINNWMFLNINFQNYDFIKVLNNDDISEEMKNILFNVCENKSFYMKIDNNISKDIFSKNLKRCNNQLSYLKFNEINDIDSYFIKNDLQFPNLKTLEIKDTSLKNSQFLKKFPNLEKLNLILCHLNLKILENLSNNITELYFVKNGFINSDFNKIISDYLLKCDSLRKNLTLLSFADNNLSKIDFNQIVFQSKQSFNSLKEIDLQKNKIYKFSINPEYFQALKVINLCYNNFTNSCFNEYKDILVLLSGNIFLMDNVLCGNYYTELEKKLNKNLPSVKSISMSYIPKLISQNYISNVKIGNSLLTDLLNLDLSFNHMNCDTFFSFIKNNKRSLNIKKFNLNGNELDDSFFEKYINQHYNELFYNLECLYINNNLIGGEVEVDYKDKAPIQDDDKDYENIIYKLRLIYKFIEVNKKMKRMSITRNPISKICKIKDANEEEIKKSIVKDENDKIIINSFYTFLLKIKNELINDNDRTEFNIRYDCRSHINLDLCDFIFDEKLIIFKRDN